MNRRELLKRGFELGAAGLLLPMVEPIRHYWSLDRTMVPVTIYGHSPIIGDPPTGLIETGWFNANAISATQWVVTGMSALAMIDGKETLIPMKQIGNHEWKAVIPSDGILIGHQFVRSPYAANCPDCSSTLR